MSRAASHNRGAVNFKGALVSAPRQEAEFQAQLSVLENAKDTSTELKSLSLLELKTQLTVTSTALRDAINELDDIKQRLASRETTAHFIRLRLEEIDQRLDKISTPGLAVTVDQQAPPSLTEAIQWTLLAEEMALIAERRAQEANLASLPIRFSALRAKAAVLELRIGKFVDKKRALEAITGQVQFDLTEPKMTGISPDNPLHVIAEQLGQDNTLLRDQRLDIELLFKAIRTNHDEVERVTRQIEERYTTARRAVEFASDSDVLGEVLLAYWQEIESFQLPKPVDRLPQQLGNKVISRIQHDQALSELASTTNHITTLINAAGLAPDTVSTTDREALAELARYKRKLLRNITHMESDYIDASRDLRSGYRHLKKLVKEYKSYLGGLILWIPSRQLLWNTDLGDIPVGFDRLLNSLSELDVDISPLFLVMLAIAVILLLVRERLHAINQSRDRRLLNPEDDSLRITFIALLVAGLRALPAPIILLSISLLFSQNSSSSASALLDTLNGLVVVVFVLDLMRILSEESGVARTHFGWRSQTCSRLYAESSWLIRWWLPFATLASFLFLAGDDTVLLGRLTLLFALFLLVGHLVRQVWRDKRSTDEQHSTTVQNRLRIVTVVILVAVIAGVVWGLRYSVIIITSRLIATLWIGVGLLIFHNLLERWLLLVRRRLYRAERIVDEIEPTIGETRSAIVKEEASLGSIGAETGRLLNAITLTIAIITSLYLWAPLFPVADAFTRITLWTSTTVIEGELVSTHISLGTLVMIVFLAAITFYAAHRLPALAELALRSRTGITRGDRYAASRLLSYGIVAVGAVIALSALGLRWSQLQWLIAALGVGIGFGLQEIIANFISGLIILFERPIRVGDIVTVGDKDGIVTKIRIRATTVLDFDGRELLVPNKEFVTGRLLNWTLSDSHIRLVIPVGIAYGSDVDEALGILERIADEFPVVLEDPEPSIVFEDFGENALQLTARFYIHSFDDYWQVITEVRSEIYKKFNEAGIVIAYPQRDIHFDSEKAIRVSLDPKEDS